MKSPRCIRLRRVKKTGSVLIPRVLLDQAGIGDEVEVEVRNGRIVIRPAGRPREGWEEQFRRMAAWGDDRLLDDLPVSLSRFDATGGVW